MATLARGVPVSTGITIDGRQGISQPSSKALSLPPWNPNRQPILLIGTRSSLYPLDYTSFNPIGFVFSVHLMLFQPFKSTSQTKIGFVFRDLVYYQ